MEESYDPFKELEVPEIPFTCSEKLEDDLEVEVEKVPMFLKKEICKPKEKYPKVNRTGMITLFNTRIQK